ncbi:MAG TPA: hypothetical protein VG347_15760 [Verrucomicrobiae bacterium]|nr:hypothetical protein [Verrucomicrobiae bacterium]
MSDSEHPVNFDSYVRTCVWVFVVAAIAVSAMIYTSFLPHYGWPLKVSIILLIAAVNAFVVAGYLMHLLSEKKLVYTVLTFTVIFVIGLFGLTLWAMTDFPVGTAVH